MMSVSVRGKAFHGVRLLHIQMSPDAEYIFPHQLRKRLFPTLSRDEFQQWKKKADIEERTMSSQEILAINNSISKSGGTTKVNDNCSLMLVKHAQHLYNFLQGQTDSTKKIDEKKDGTAKVLTGGIITIEVAQFKGKPLLHLNFAPGSFLLLNQLRRLLFCHITKHVFLGLMREHGLSVYTMEGRDCERVNLFLRLNPGLSRDVDRNSPLVSCQDAERLCTAAKRLSTVVKSTAANGTAANGNEANGTVANGTVANGTVANGNAANSTAANSTAANSTVTNGNMANGTAANGSVVNREESLVGEHTNPVTDSVPDMKPVIKPDTLPVTYEVQVPDTAAKQKVTDTKPQEQAYYSTCTDSSSEEEAKPQLQQDNKELVTDQKTVDIKPDPDEAAAPQQHDKSLSTCTDVPPADDTQPPNNTAQVSGQKRHMGNWAADTNVPANTNVPNDEPLDMPQDVPMAPPAKKKHCVVERAHKMKVARQKSQWYMRHSANRPQIDLSDLRLRNVEESEVRVDEGVVTVGDATIAGRRFTVLRDHSELQCIVSEVFKLFLGSSYDYQKRQWWQKRCEYAERQITSLEYSALTHTRRRVFRLSKLMSVASLQRVLARYRSMAAQRGSIVPNQCTVTHPLVSIAPAPATTNSSLWSGIFNAPYSYSSDASHGVSTTTNVTAMSTSVGPKINSVPMELGDDNDADNDVDGDNDDDSKDDNDGDGDDPTDENTVHIVLKDCQPVDHLSTTLSPSGLGEKFVRVESTSSATGAGGGGEISETGAGAGGRKISVPKSNASNSAFQSSDYVLIPKTFLQAEDSHRCVLIERRGEKKLHIRYMDKPNQEQASREEQLQDELEPPSGQEGSRVIGSVSAVSCNNIASEKCEAQLQSYVNMFVQSQSMMKQSMSGLLRLSIDMQRELCQLEEEIAEERDVNDSLNRQLELLTAQHRTVH